MGRSCIHFTCHECGGQVVCIETRLGPEELLTCRRGHRYVLTEEEREKINFAFREYVGGAIEVFL